VLRIDHVNLHYLIENIMDTIQYSIFVILVSIINYIQSTLLQTRSYLIKQKMDKWISLLASHKVFVRVQHQEHNYLLHGFQ